MGEERLQYQSGVLITNAEKIAALSTAARRAYFFSSASRERVDKDLAQRIADSLGQSGSVVISLYLLDGPPETPTIGYRIECTPVNGKK